MKYDFQEQLNFGKEGEEITLLYLRDWCERNGYDLRDTRRIHRVKLVNGRLRKTRDTHGSFAYPDFRVINRATGKSFYFDAKRKNARTPYGDILLKLDEKMFTEYQSLGTLMKIPVIVLFYADNKDAEHFYMLDTQNAPPPFMKKRFEPGPKGMAIEWEAPSLTRVPIINN